MPEKLEIFAKRPWISMKLQGLVILALLLTGCGGGVSGGASNGGGSNSTPTSGSEFLYATSSNNIYVFVINPTTGALSDYTVTALPKTNRLITTNTVEDPEGKFLYYFDAPDSDIESFSISANGSLTPSVGSPFSAGTSNNPGGLGWLAIDPGGRFLYFAIPLGVTFPNPVGVGVFSIDRPTGSLTPVPGSPFSDIDLPFGVLADPAGKFVYVANADSTLSGFEVDPGSGTLTPIPGSPFPTPVEAVLFYTAADPAGRFLYASFPFTNTVGPSPPAPIPANSIAAWSIDSTTGSLTVVSGSPFVTGNVPGQMVIDPAGKFLYVPNAQDRTVSGFTIDAVSGALTPMTGSPFAISVASLAIDPSGKFLFARIGATVAGFSINASTGSLTAVGNAAPLPAGDPARELTTVKVP